MEDYRKRFELSECFDIYGGLLTDKQRLIFDCFYFQDLTLSEIAENEGITRQAVRDALLRCEELLSDAEHKLHLCERFHRISASCRQIREIAAEMLELNSKNYFDSRITSAMRSIIENTATINGEKYNGV